MFISHIFSFLLKSFLALAVVFSLISCSSGASSDAGVDSLNGGSSNPAAASILNLSWVAPAEREDNSVLMPNEISSFYVYYGTEAGNYPNKVSIDSCACSLEGAQLTNISPGQYYVVITTVDSDGRESGYSAEVVVTI